MTSKDPLDLLARALCERFAKDILELSPNCFEDGCIEKCKINRFKCPEKIYRRNQLYFANGSIRWMFYYGECLKLYDLLRRLYCSYCSLRDFRSDIKEDKKGLLTEYDRTQNIDRAKSSESEYEIVAYDENNNVMGVFSNKVEMSKKLKIKMSEIVEIYETMRDEPEKKLKYHFETRKKK